MEVPYVGVLCGQVSGLEILLCEGGDVEQWLEPRNTSCCLRLIDCLSTLSLFVHCIYSYYHIIYMLVLCLALIHIAYSYMLGCAFLCASLVLNHESFI